MSLSDIFVLTAVILFSDGLYRAEICCFREKYNQTLFRILNEPLRHHFHEVHHDVVSFAIAGVKVDLRAFLETRILEIKESQFLQMLSKISHRSLQGRILTQQQIVLLL